MKKLIPVVIAIVLIGIIVEAVLVLTVNVSNMRTYPGQPLPVTDSSGIAPAVVHTKADLHNYADIDEFYKDGVPKDENGRYIYSHNVFKVYDNEEWTVDLSSDKYDENGFYGISYKNIICGDDRKYDFLCTVDNNGSASPGDMATIVEPFTLEAEDYNNDGVPDFCVRVSDPMRSITYYTLIEHNDLALKGYDLYSLSDRAYDLTEKDVNPSLRKTRDFAHDNTFCVWGRGEPSIIFERIDDRYFYFITLNERRQPETVIFDNQFNYVSPGRIGCSYDGIVTVDYKDGMVCIKHTALKYDDGLYFDGEYRVTDAFGGKDKNKSCLSSMPRKITFEKINEMQSYTEIPAESFHESGRYEISLYQNFDRAAYRTLRIDIDTTQLQEN